MSLDINLTGVEKTSNKKTTLTDNSDTFYPTQKAVKTAVDAKENTITAGTTAQYFRGDKTFQTLDKTAVGLSNVDNTSDANKPVSTATQTALNTKFNTPTGTTAQYLRGDGTVATFPTIPDPSDFVEKSDFTSHSILAKQSGAGDPVAISIGNNEILGRKSGGGSDIEGLSVSEVKSLLGYTASDVGAVAINSAITGATKTKITYDSKGLVTSGADATTADIADSSNKRYVTDANLTVIGNTSGTNTGDETQSSILAKLGLVLSKKIGSTSVTGTTVESILHSFKVNANSLSTSDLIKIFASTVKVNTNNSYALRIRHNTINSLSGSTQIAILSVSILANLNVNFSRQNLIIEGGNLTGFSFTTSSISETNTQFAGSLSSTPFDVTVDNYFFITVQLNSGLDSISLRHFLLQNF
jgi:hypothetical protein